MKFELDSATEILRQTPDMLTQMLSGLSTKWTVTKDDKTDWSPYDVVGHLIHCEETDWIPRAEVILAQGEDRTFPPFDRFAQFEKYRDQSLPELLTEFKRARTEGLATLAAWNLTPEKLALRGVHPDLGEVTLEQLLSTWVVHDLGHIRQIVVYMAKKYEDAVGPWKQFLSILK
ncbi:MAG TPA: DinB family protein [Pyrinomonadaceae bacterium]|nr:DinB family protein [Acidobacteriota bacterium]HQZ97251.1 DinB family protein [Pyrinomonadaceae bacterium]